MKYLFYFGAMLLLLFPNILQAQQHSCGVHTTAKEIQYEQITAPYRNRINTQNIQRTQTTIALKPQIVRRSNGTGGLSISTLYDAVDDLNAIYSVINVQFVICTPNYINNDGFYNNPIVVFGTSDDNLDNNNVSNMVNIYFVPDINSSSGGSYSGYASFPGELPGRDRILVDKDVQTSVMGLLLAHELGHYFNLYHTHETAFGAELVTRGSGSNCTNAGDLLCDTPADPGLNGSNVDANCNYIGTAVDANGWTYNPSTANIMSYSAINCWNLFSTQQQNRMTQSLLLDRNYLVTSCPCEQDLVVNTTQDDVNITYKANGTISSDAEIINNSDVEFDAGGTISLNGGFKVELGSAFKTLHNGCVVGTFMTIGDLFADELAGLPDPRDLMATNVSETAAEGSATFSCYPNPATDQITLAFSGQWTEAVTIQLTDVNGRILSQYSDQLTGQHNNFTLDVSTLPAAVYFVVVQTTQQREVQKLIIQR